MERRSQARIETRFEVVWSAGSLDGQGSLRILSLSGAWIDDASTQPLLGARVRIVVLDLVEEARDPLVADGVVVRRSSEGFAIEFHAASSPEIKRLLDRIAEEADPLG